MNDLFSRERAAGPSGPACSSFSTAAEPTRTTGCHWPTCSELRSALDEAVADASDIGASEGRFLEGSAAELLAAESTEPDLLVAGLGATAC